MILSVTYDSRYILFVMYKHNDSLQELNAKHNAFIL